jgi:5'-3' exonuclease
VDVYLVDGTYELFRHFFAVPKRRNDAGREIAATRGVLGSVLYMLESGATHLGVATDQVIESFRNDLWPAYKTSEGVDPLLMQQFPLLEEGLAAMGVTIWPMVEMEADDALASAARIASMSPEVEHVFICTPDKDMAQCVRDERVVMLDRRKNVVSGHGGVVAKFGVPPASIPDYLALVGDSADGYPGLPGWGAKGTGTVLSRFGTIEAIPDDSPTWDLTLRGIDKMAAVLRENRDLALLFKDLATLRSQEPLFEDVDALRWRGPTSDFAAFCEEVEGDQLLMRAEQLAKRRPTAV